MSVEHLWWEVDKHTWGPLDCILKELSAVVWVNDSLKVAGKKSCAVLQNVKQNKKKKEHTILFL